MALLSQVGASLSHPGVLGHLAVESHIIVYLFRELKMDC
jgi:hypothetical protein